MSINPGPQPMSVVHLKVAEEQDKTMWVTEEPHDILNRIALARSSDEGRVGLSRWACRQRHAVLDDARQHRQPRAVHLEREQA